MDRVSLLLTIPMFEGLSDEDLDALAASLEEQRLGAGDIIFEQGAAGQSMYVVADGVVNILLHGEHGALSLADVSEGQFFGEIALFDDKPRSASAQARTDCVLLELKREVLTGHLKQRPGVALSILRTMSDRLRKTNEALSQHVARNFMDEYDIQRTWKDRVADRVSALNGSWAFIGILAGLMAIWMALNARQFLADAPDPYPYIFFNLLLAILIAVQWPLIVMSQNRAAQKDRVRAEADFEVNLKNETNCEALLDELRAFRAQGIDLEPDVDHTESSEADDNETPPIP